MTTQPFPERDPQASDKAQGVYRKYDVRRADGKPEKPGAEHFVLDAVHDKHAIPALAAYAESCQVEYPALAHDIMSRWVAPRQGDTPAGQRPPSVAAAVAPDASWRKLRISRTRMVEVGLSEKAADMLCVPPHATPEGLLWPRLVRMDGMLALAVLPPDMLAKLAAEIRNQGAAIPVNSAAQITHYIYIAAEQFCPRDEWYDKGLVSAVSAGLLLRLAEDAFGASDIVIAKSLPH